MNAKCYICEEPAALGCRDCGGFYCSAHGVPPYCLFCAFRHDDPEPLRHARYFHFSLSDDKTISRLLRLLRDPDPTVRYRVADVLRGTAELTVVAALIEILKYDKNRRVRNAAFSSLLPLRDRASDIRRASYGPVFSLSWEALHDAWLERKVDDHWRDLEESGGLPAGPDYGELQQQDEKYQILCEAIDITLTGRTREVRAFLYRGIRNLGECDVEWARQRLGSATDEDLRICLRREFNTGGLNWETIRSSTLERDWKGAGLPLTNEKEEEGNVREWVS